MKQNEREFLKLVHAAFRESAINGGYSYACELFGYDPEEELNENFMLDTSSVPESGPITVVVYNLVDKEAYEIEIDFAVRDVAEQPFYEQLFSEQRQNCEKNNFDTWIQD